MINILDSARGSFYPWFTFYTFCSNLFKWTEIIRLEDSLRHGSTWKSRAMNLWILLRSEDKLELINYCIQLQLNEDIGKWSQSMLVEIAPNIFFQMHLHAL